MASDVVTFIAPSKIVNYSVCGDYVMWKFLCRFINVSPFRRL